MFIFTYPLQLKTQTHDVENVQITFWDMAALVSAEHHIHSPRMTRSPDLELSPCPVCTQRPVRC